MNENSDVYGINPEGEVTPLMVRDAIIKCFTQAHCVDSGIDESEVKANELYCKQIVEKAFKDANDDFENPTRDGIMRVLENLKEFALNFRDPSIIEKHYGEIMQLVNRM